MRLWLRYKEGGTLFTTRLDAVVYKDLPEVRRIQGETLRDVEFSHRKSWRLQHTITISADELVDEAKLAFIRAFWVAERCWLSLNPSSTVPADDQFRELRPPVDVCPLEFVEEIVELPEITLELIDKYKA